MGHSEALSDTSPCPCSSPHALTCSLQYHHTVSARRYVCLSLRSITLTITVTSTSYLTTDVIKPAHYVRINCCLRRQKMRWEGHVARRWEDNTKIGMQEIE